MKNNYMGEQKVFRARGILSIAIFLLSVTLPGPYATSQQAQPHCFITSALQLPEQNKKNEVWMTVFVHGSVMPLIKRPSVSRVFKILADRLEGTLCERATQIIRNNPFLTRSQPMQEMGLQKIEKMGDPTFPATLIANIFDKLDGWLHDRDPHNNLLYTYGWSGIMGQTMRYQASKQLYNNLAQEIKRLNNIGIAPKIRIIGFCHGANVCINLARVVQKEKLDFTFDIDELILISMPIDKTMNPLLDCPLFKKIYSLYSTNDWIQRLDILAPGTIFTRRLFMPRKGKKLPHKLKQVRIKIMCNKKTKRPFPKGKDPQKQFDYRPASDIISGQSPLLKDMSPGHIEQWFFGWTDQDYRHTFPLYPLPVLSLLPAIINAVYYLPKTETHGRCTVDIRPDQKMMIITSKDYYVIQKDMLPGARDLSELLSLVPQPYPAQDSTHEYWQQVDLGIKQAKQEMRNKKQKRTHQAL